MTTPEPAPLPFWRSGATFAIATMLGNLNITFCTPRIVRVRLVVQGDLDDPSYVLPTQWDPVQVAVSAGESLTLDSGSCVVRVDQQPLALTFCDAAGVPALQVPIEAGIAVENVHAHPAPEGTQRQRLSASFDWFGEQHFYGLGEGGKQFDRLDGARQLWNSHFGHGPGSDIGVPLLLSTRGYGLFFDTTSDALLTMGRADDGMRIVFQAQSSALDLYYLWGTDLRGVLSEAAVLLGRAPLPPRWSLGFLQSSRHFADTAAVRDLPRTLRDKRIPCDAIIFLSTYGEAMGWNRGVGHLAFQPELIPEPAALLAELHDQGFEVITHEYPVLHEESALFSDADRAGYLLAEGYERRIPAERPSTEYHEGQRLIDFTNPAARAWWWEQHRPLADLGVSGWWLDGGEGPCAETALQAGDGRLWHNMYDRLRHQAFAEGEARDYSARRPFLLCRSGAAGMQRYGAACWSGDINNTFATLEAQIPLGLNTGMSGIPYWGTDIGGFFQPMPESGELYARWFQFGAFCPGFRAHGHEWYDHVPWAHGPEIEAICRRYAELRYRLLPYTYTLAWQAHLSGLPFMRPLVLNYPDDPAVWELGSEYLWGDDLLVAPVTRAGATAWAVYLPSGTWYDYWTLQRYQGPVGVTVAAPLERLPLFVRGGAILPLAPLAQFDGERVWDEITLFIYPSGTAHFELYEDDGRTSAYREGHYAVTPIRCVAEDDRITIDVGVTSGDSSVLPSNRTYTLRVLTAIPARVVLDGSVLPRGNEASGQGSRYWTDARGFTAVRLERSSGRITIVSA